MLSTLRAIVHAVNAAQGLQDTFDIIVTETSSAMATDICSIYLLDKNDKSHLLVASHGLNSKKQGKVRVPANRGVISSISLKGEAINLVEGTNHKDFYEIPNSEEASAHAFLGVPIIHHRKILGALVVQQKTKRIFTEDDEAFLVTLSAQLAGIIVNMELKNQIESKKRTKSPTRFKASSSAPGIAIGKGWVVAPSTSLLNVPTRKTGDIDLEIKRLRKAMARSRKDIRELATTLSNTLAKQELALFTAYEQILSHNSLGKKIELLIKENSYWASTALRKVIDENVQRFTVMDDPYLKERATDILDLGRRVLNHLEDQIDQPRKYPKNTILISEQLTSSMIAEVPAGQLSGIISIRGSATSHAAILAKSMGIPALMGLRDCPMSSLEGKSLILDGYKNALFVKPGRTLTGAYKQLQINEQKMLEDLQDKNKKETRTLDGVSIPLMINSGMLADVEMNHNIQVDGVGLFRSEYPFMQNERFPGEEEQRHLYRQLLEKYHPKPVVIRTLDIGGDKTLSYFPIDEDNPFLGWRGIRITLDHPEIFYTQIRAMLMANIGLGNLQISLPMISTLSEIDRSLRLIQQVYDEIIDELDFSQEEFPFPEIGIVIEVPSAVYQIRSIAKRIDFISIGSNDLTQYMFAVDRNNTRVSYLYKSLHPAILFALMEICEAGNAAEIPVHVCGEIAGDPLATVVLLAMGVNALSMDIHAIPKVRKVIQNFKMSDASEILSRALSFETTYDVREYLISVLQVRGLADLVDPGHMEPE